LSIKRMKNLTDRKLGAIARNISSPSSNWRSTTSLPDYLKQLSQASMASIPAPSQNPRCWSYQRWHFHGNLDEAELLEQVLAPSMTGMRSHEVTTGLTQPHQFEEFKPTVAEPLTVVAIDFGIKRISCAAWQVMVAASSLSQLDTRNSSWQPDGITGPGDPAAVKASRQRNAEQPKPMFGICMGHQILVFPWG